jgi:hypothetical protein
MLLTFSRFAAIYIARRQKVIRSNERSFKVFCVTAESCQEALFPFRPWPGLLQLAQTSRTVSILSTFAPLSYFLSFRLTPDGCPRSCRGGSSTFQLYQSLLLRATRRPQLSQPRCRRWSACKFESNYEVLCKLAFACDQAYKKFRFLKYPNATCAAPAPLAPYRA